MIWKNKPASIIQSRFKHIVNLVVSLTSGLALCLTTLPTQVRANSVQAKKPNILVIYSDDVGIWNISAYHRGMMGGRTPNIDLWILSHRAASDGVRF